MVSIFLTLNSSEALFLAQTVLYKKNKYCIMVKVL